MASPDTAPEVDLKRLYELNDLYQSKKNKKKKKSKKKKEIHNNAVIQVDEKPKIDGEIQYVSSKIDIDRADPNYSYFSNIFNKFKLNDPAIVEPSLELQDDDIINKLKPILPELPDEDEEEPEQMLSKKKLKTMSRMSIANLKQRVLRPEVVEVHDANSKAPVLLIHLKSYRNTAPVPKHWSYKRKYLQGKRGFVKPPFELPDNIKATGIMEMRSAFNDREESRNLRAKMRHKIRPKLGKGEIDYQRLHDAFFKYQTKPRMTMHGDLYYEGKEFEVRLKQKKPGDISDDLRISLGMPVGVNKHLVPPPWLIAMQRYGPPPSYPNLRIPGLNAPIPEGATFGYHAGGWGKPPVDELGRPLYGDVFGTNLPPEDTYAEDDEIDKSVWGELELQELSSEESDEEMEDVAPIPAELSSALVPYNDGLTTPTLTVSVSEKSGLEKVQHLELRKRKTEPKTESHLYSVIPERKVDQGPGLLNTSHTYDMKNKKDLRDDDEIEEIEMDIEPEPITETPEPVSRNSEKSTSKHSSKSKKPTDSKNHKKSREFKF